MVGPSQTARGRSPRGDPDERGPIPTSGSGAPALEGFTLTEEIHRGRTRVVYRAIRTADDRPVILKTLIDALPSRRALAALRREYETLAHLATEGVARALDLVEVDRRLVLVLEDAGGEQLARVLAAGRLGVGNALWIAHGLASILRELHRHNVVHRDLNPNNILVHRAAQRVTLIDFSIASRLPAEHQELRHPNALEGTIAYMSPEQTGRMNRDIDYRTDFYSLGVTFYELLTGRLPFETIDPLELIHCHIARTPPSPSEIEPAIPHPVSAIVMKLMAKAAEERYQSARRLQADLGLCRSEWEADRHVSSVVPGREDFGDRFLLPQRLYGRERPLARLLTAFDEVAAGRIQIMLVSGYPGVGKSSLIRELYKPLVGRRGYFIGGKFDQIVRVPYGALLQAFRELVQQLLTEDEEQLAAWRARLTEALGIGAAVLAEVVPEVQLIVGLQSPPSALGPAETQNRFRLVFQNFLSALARREHPLVMFLDDLQWADAATLNLLEPLLASSEIECLLLIGAYRDNEVDEAHALTRTLGELDAAGVATARLPLEPLTLTDLTLFVRDTLHCELAEAEPLARLVSQKTEGNPFFVGQFLKALRDADLLTFDHELERWTFGIDAIAQARMTDNVIDLMTRKIRGLPDKTQRALTLAACIGNVFDQQTLAIVSEQSPEAAAEDLEEAIREGLILPAARRYDASEARDAGAAAAVAAYAFLHDRVQQSAYALIPAERRQIVHLTVGRLLHSRVDPDHADEKIFDIVHHLNLGRVLIQDDAERVALAALNLRAGQKAKSSTAHDAALGYLRIGLDVATEALWDSDYGLAFALHLEAAECRYLCGDFDEAEQEFALLLQRAATSLDKARVYRLRSLQYENMSRYGDALATAQESLALFGVSFPDAPEEREAALDREIASIQSLLGDRTIASLLDLPVMTDPEVRMVMNTLTDIWASAYILGDPVLARLISATMVRLSLVHGNLEESAYGYVTHAITVGPVRGDYESAYEFGVLALRVNERFNDSRRRAKIHQQFHAHVNPWRRPLQTCIPYAREACRSGLESGDFLYAAYGASTEAWPAMLSTQDLAGFVREYAPNLALIRKLKATAFADSFTIILNWARALQGETGAPLSLSGEGIDENDYVNTYRGNPFFTTFYAVAKLHLSYVFGEHASALEAARLARGVVYHLSGTIWPVMFDFWNGLTLAASYADAAEGERSVYLEEMERAQQSLAVLAENCPENFLCQSLLLSAEIERIAGRHLSAVDRYERAIRYAGETKLLQDQALANELCARFWLERKQANVAAVYLADARYAWARWGAAAKVLDLEDRYREALDGMPRGAPRPGAEPRSARPSAQGTTEVGASVIDLDTVMKAAHVLAGEIDLERLLGKLMAIAIENAGAERGGLVLERDDGPRVHAEGSADRVGVRVHDAPLLATADAVPNSIVNYVRRTSESLVLTDARNDDRYRHDAYIVSRQPRSVLCTPLVNQGRLLGVVYLENNLVTDAFTPERIQVVQLLCSQSAIAIQNAELFAEVSRLRDRLEAENVYLQEEIKTHHGFEGIVGNSPALQRVLRQVEQVAPTDTTVLITGETGSGKELIARALHELSQRPDGPLITLNCGAISAGLVESELFGHEKGAFTGALARKIGRFELADGGTIFLDEIGDLPPDLQVKLLRVLQQGEFERVGGTHTVRVDVRVVAATHHSLDQAVRHGRFRSDLYYRLNVFPVHVPPLRERRDDIPLLTRHFVLQFSGKMGKAIETIPKATMDALLAYPWPGNVRELRNVVERSVIVSPGPGLELRDWIVDEPPDATAPVNHSLEQVEREHILRVLERSGWRVSGPKGAARILGLKPTTLESRMKKLGIERPH